MLQKIYAKYLLEKCNLNLCHRQVQWNSRNKRDLNINGKLKKIIKRFRLDSLLIPSIDFLLIYFACQIGIRYRNISYEIIRSDLEVSRWLCMDIMDSSILWRFIFSLSNQYRALFGLFTTKNIYKLFLYSFF